MERPRPRLRALGRAAMLRAMPYTRDQLMARFDELDIPTTTHEHPAVFTVEEAKALRGGLSGAHSKNLFLKDKKGELFLVVALEDRPIDLKALRHLIGAKQLSFGKPELLLEILGITPGAVTPLALINDTACRVNVVLDAEMMAQTPLNFHPLDNTATTQISPDGLLAFIRACGHTPNVVAL